MRRVQVIKGTQFKSAKNTYTCTSVWFLGNNVSRYELIDKNGKEIETSYDELHDKIKKGLLTKI